MADLDAERIVQAALAIAERDGPDGLTMRAVADEIGVTPTALYRHVEDKRALISLMVDAVVAEHALPAPTGDWREDLWQMAQAMRAMTHAHPAVTELRRGHQIWSPTVLPLTERWMSIWAQSGLPLELAIRAGITSSLAITGVVEEELLLSRMQRPKEAALTWVPNARLACGIERDRDADFELIVRAVVDGVHARLAADAGEQATG
jgi:TetR/AcrR family transcriptional regulator, tetracycline repressor protein